MSMVTRSNIDIILSFVKGIIMKLDILSPLSTPRYAISLHVAFCWTNWLFHCIGWLLVLLLCHRQYNIERCSWVLFYELLNQITPRRHYIYGRDYFKNHIFFCRVLYNLSGVISKKLRTTKTTSFCCRVFVKCSLKGAFHKVLMPSAL
jgi:hypothetical protein